MMGHGTQFVESGFRSSARCHSRTSTHGIACSTSRLRTSLAKSALGGMAWPGRNSRDAVASASPVVWYIIVLNLQKKPGRYAAWIDTSSRYQNALVEACITARA